MQRLMRMEDRLPILMFVLSWLLVLLAAKQLPTLRGMGTGWVVPATTINALINGPGYYLIGWIPIPVPHALNERLGYEGGRLFGIAVFWFLIGLSIDRRRGGQRLGRQHPILIGVWFTFCALICGVFGIGLGLAEFRYAIFWRLLARYPLRSQSLITLGFVVWLLGLCGYFCRRVFIAARQSLEPTA